MIDIKCKVCGKSPEELQEYQDCKEENETATEYCWHEEGTLNKQTGLFYCTECYVKVGMPLGKA